MIDDEWLSCVHPDKLLRAQGFRGNRRRWALFVCACCRRVWDLLTDPQARQAVELAECLADLSRPGRPGRRRLEVIRAAAQTRDPERGRSWLDDLTAVVADTVASPLWSAYRILDLLPRALEGTYDDVPPRGKRARRRAHREAWCDLVRDILCHPDQPPALDPAWLTWRGGLVPTLARQIYDERRFGELPVLADALEDAGCVDAALLAHCRQPTAHARGCWAVDLLLNLS